MAELKAAGVDFIYLGSSSFLRSNRKAVADAAEKNGIPVLSPYEQLVRDSQALISVAARYYDVGRLAGEQAERILVSKMTPGDLPVSRMTNFAVVINIGIAKKLKLFPPLDLLQVAETVNRAETELSGIGYERTSPPGKLQSALPPIGDIGKPSWRNVGALLVSHVETA